MSAAAPDDGRPRRFEDLPWRFRRRTLRVLLGLFGPPSLSGDADPRVRLDRERAQRWAERARRRASS